MWRKVNGEALGTQTVYKTFSFRHLFSWNVEGLLFSVYLQHQCLMRTCHHSIWKQTPVWAFLHAIITYLRFQPSLFHLQGLAQCPVISIERASYGQACTALCSKLSENGSEWLCFITQAVPNLVSRCCGCSPPSSVITGSLAAFWLSLLWWSSPCRKG